MLRFCSLPLRLMLMHKEVSSGLFFRAENKHGLFKVCFVFLTRCSLLVGVASPQQTQSLERCLQVLVLYFVILCFLSRVVICSKKIGPRAPIVNFLPFTHSSSCKFCLELLKFYC